MEIYWSGKIIKINKIYLLEKISAIFVASLLMGGLLLIIKNTLHVVLCVAIGALVYFAISYVFGLINKQDLLFFKNIIKFKK
ncbi:unnamed protein product [marine sediment metagenome]|uniref:Polysaccharide biosynthesis protein C-terminal domain-containing protein n=1 Tax=marine sediment metagenome TaxID=412755 RepID=X1M2S8_9ZZZZ